MTDSRDPTIRDVLLDGSPPPLWSRLGPAVAVAGSMMGLRWGRVVKEIAARTNELLDVELPGLVADAWEKAPELKKYRDPARMALGKKVVKKLGKHTIDLEYDPVLTLKVNGVRLPDVEVHVVLALNLEALSLTVEGGAARRGLAR